MLTVQHVQQYQAEGYCVLDNLLSDGEVSRMLEEIDLISAGATVERHDATRLEMEPGQPPQGDKVRRIYEPCTYYGLFQKFAESARLLDCVEQLIGPNIFYFSSKINIKPAEIGSIVEWHQDMAYGPVTNRSVLAVLIYLDDADATNGCLQVVPGQFRMLDHSRNGLFQGKITEPLDTSKAVPIERGKGAAVFFQGLAPHASAPNRSPKRRRTLILGYRAADAFPIHLGAVTLKGDQHVRLVRGQESPFARFDMEQVLIPRYPKDTKSLYELQELSRQAEATGAN